MILLDILNDVVLDILKLLPFLFLTYLFMEYLENKTSETYNTKIQKAGKYGPLIGGVLGIIPQCGFSASITNLYASGITTIGTLLAVYLSTSDEMIPILISNSVPLIQIVKILLIKLVIGISFGFLIDFLFKKKLYTKTLESEDNICEQEHCNCKKNGILKASLIHTLNITIYIFIFTFIINLLITLIGENTIENFIQNNLFLGPLVCSLIGLIPNCAASVIITNLYTTNIINFASLIAGLLTGSGIGLMILFKINKKNIKENILITLMLYTIGVFSGCILQLIGIH